MKTSIYLSAFGLGFTIFFIWSLFMYCLWSFVINDFNPTNWQEGQRACFAFFGLFCGFGGGVAVFGAIIAKSTENEKPKN